jgi:ABC-2 type transport system permease protein
MAALNPIYYLIVVIRGPLLGQEPPLLDWFIVIAIAIVGWAMTIQMLTKFRQRIVYWL